MTDDKIEPKREGLLEQTAPEQVDQQLQQNKTSAAADSVRAAQGRRPLFRN